MSSTAVFVTMGLTLAAIPIAVAAGIACRRVIMRRAQLTRSHKNHRLREFRLRPQQQDMSLPTPPEAAKVSFTTPATTHNLVRADTRRARLSRPPSFSVHLSSLNASPQSKKASGHPRPPTPPTKDPSFSRHLSTTSSAPSACTMTFVLENDNSNPYRVATPISPLSVHHPSPDQASANITPPPPIHAPTATVEQWHRSVSRHRASSRSDAWPLTYDHDLEKGEDLFINVPLDTQDQFDAGVDVIEPLEIAHGGGSNNTMTSSRQIAGNRRPGLGHVVGHAAPKPSTRVRNTDDREWQKARMETVDGILAPREWI